EADDLAALHAEADSQERVESAVALPQVLHLDHRVQVGLSLAVEPSNLLSERPVSTSVERRERSQRPGGFERPFIEPVDARERRAAAEESAQFFDLGSFTAHAHLDTAVPEITDVTLQASQAPGQPADRIPEPHPLDAPVDHESPRIHAVGHRATPP